MKVLSTFFPSFLLLSAQASITGSDDRHEVRDAPFEVQEISHSIAALVRKKNLTWHTDGTVELNGLSYQKDLNFCEDARFTQHQKLIANCSASLIEEDLILTAGHCVEEGSELNLKEFVAVFDYKVTKSNQNKFIVSASSVFELISAPLFDFNFPGDHDIATIRLDRPVKNREPLRINYKRVQKGEEIYMLGFPFGLAMKYTDNGYVTKEHGNFGDAKDSFTSDLDSFSVNSGSAVFNQNNQIIGVLVRGTGRNYERDEQRECNDWGGLVSPRDYFSEINYIDLIKRD